MPTKMTDHAIYSRHGKRILPLSWSERDTQPYQISPMAHVPDDIYDVVILLYYATQHNQIMQPIEASSATRLNLWWSKCDECINRQRPEETRRDCDT